MAMSAYLFGTAQHAGMQHLSLLLNVLPWILQILGQEYVQIYAQGSQLLLHGNPSIEVDSRDRCKFQLIIVVLVSYCFPPHLAFLSDHWPGGVIPFVV